MKQVFYIMLALAAPWYLQAQISKSFPINSAHKIKLDFQYGSLKIEKHSGNEIIVTGSFILNGIPSEDRISFESNTNGNTFFLSSKAYMEELTKKQIIIQENGSKIYKDVKSDNIIRTDCNKQNNGTYYGTNIEGNFTIMIPENIELEIQALYGSILLNDYWDNLKVHSTYGKVEVVIPNAIQNPKLDLHSTYDLVDLTISEKSNATLSLTTSYGKIYTDHTIKTTFPDSSTENHVGQDVSAQLGNGTVTGTGTGTIKIQSTYDNVYLRKI